MADQVLPAVYPSEDYSGKRLNRHQRHFHSNVDAYRIGPAALRQVRVKPGNPQCRHLIPELNAWYANHVSFYLDENPIPLYVLLKSSNQL